MDETARATTTVREAIAYRLDVRCIQWKFIPEKQPRCGRCDGCIAQRWVDDGMPAVPPYQPITAQEVRDE